MNISVLGAGAWGSAMAIAFAQRHPTMLWGRNPTIIRAIESTRENLIALPGFRFPQLLVACEDFERVAHHACGEHGLIVIATSVSGLRPVLESLKNFHPKNVIWLCKGFEESTQKLPHQVTSEILSSDCAIGALSGPSFAQEVARGLPCALTIASSNEILRQKLVDALHGNAIRVYSSDDLVGVEVGGAVKNIMAIATGITDGLGLGLNARAALITRGLAEITRLAVTLGGRVETMMGLAGLGDLILTCTGDLSRNRRVGLALAEGKSLTQIVNDLGHVAEGVRCAQTVRLLAQQLNIEMPITDAVCRVLFEGVPPHKMVENLLARESRKETLS